LALFDLSVAETIRSTRYVHSIISPGKALLKLDRVKRREQLARQFCCPNLTSTYVHNHNVLPLKTYVQASKLWEITDLNFASHNCPGGV
jgi:hypothetical protein